MPNRRESRIAVNAATSEPAAPIEKTMPIRPGERPSSRTANTRKIENATLKKKFDVAVHPACARRFGLPRTKRRPSLSSVHMLGLRPSIVATSGAAPPLRIPRMKSPEATKLSASRSTAYGAVKTSHEHAAEARAADLRRRAADLELRVPLDDLVAVDERREVRHVRDVEEDLEDPDEEADDEELPERQDVCDVRDGDRRGESAARPKSPTIRIGRRGRRSTQTPAGSVKRMNGRNSTVVERGDLEGAGVEDEDRNERQREPADLRAELADRLGRPQLQEVAVAPETPGRPEATHRRLGGSLTSPTEERIAESMALAVRVCGIAKVRDCSRASRRSKRAGPSSSADVASRLRLRLSSPEASSSSATWRSISAEIAPPRSSFGIDSSPFSTNRRATRP